MGALLGVKGFRIQGFRVLGCNIGAWGYYKGSFKGRFSAVGGGFMVAELGLGVPYLNTFLGTCSFKEPL